MSSTPIKILLVEDDELFRLGLRIRLEQETELAVVAEAEDGETAVDLAQHHSVDVVILDIGLPGIGGIEACRQIKQQHPHLPILVLTSRTQKSLIARLINVGAQGYCLKGVASETLILAVRSVVAGASWWDANATAEIRATVGDSSDATVTEVEHKEESWNPLTQREQEILALIVAGKTNQQIAKTLYITPGTVRVHVHAILSKLGVRDRYQAAQAAIQKKLIDEDLLPDQ
jgi:two-component system, NarL family, response regulator